MHVARSSRARLLGLALLRDLPPEHALLLPGCRSVHTFGMRFALDLVFLDAHGRILREVRGLRPCRVAGCRDAAAVLERRAAEDGMIPAMSDQAFGSRFREALDPRVPIYRDSYNEYFMLVLSAGGAAAGTQVPLYIVMAITGLWGVVPFAAACVVFELVVIFGLARPQMEPPGADRVGRALELRDRGDGRRLLLPGRRADALSPLTRRGLTPDTWAVVGRPTPSRPARRSTRRSCPPRTSCSGPSGATAAPRPPRRGRRSRR